MKDNAKTYGGWIRFFRAINALYWIIGALCLVAIPPLIYVTWSDRSFRLTRYVS